MQCILADKLSLDCFLNNDINLKNPACFGPRVNFNTNFGIQSSFSHLPQLNY